MSLPLRVRALTTLLLFVAAWSSPARAGEAVVWRSYSPEVFAAAKREHRLVLLDLEAVWCHWCHVMEKTTYRDPKVTALLGGRYLAVRADQDASPDLASRYGDWGWPATILFDENGRELAKRRGYIEPDAMASMLQAFADDPTPGPSAPPEAPRRFGKTGALSGAQRAELSGAHVEGYDAEHAGWGFSHKYVEADDAEWSLLLARSGDASADKRVRDTLAAARSLLDPAWGGVYQYSAGGDWNEPHFEKIVSMQASNLRTYALASVTLREPQYREAADAIHRYLATFLKSPEGAFFVSQDADLVPGEHAADYFALDDAGRRARGVPRIDTHLYSRENGWVIEALALYAAATSNRVARDEAKDAARWVLAHRALPGGGFRHDTTDAAGPFLGDTLAMGRAFLALHGATGEREWLRRAREAARFVERCFRMPRSARSAGFATAAPRQGRASRLFGPERDENASLARFANLLVAYTGDPRDRALAREAMRFVAAPEVAKRMTPSTLLLADTELSTEPIHLAVVGRKDDPAARALFEEAAAYPASYKRVDFWDRREGRLPNPGTDYPDLSRAAAFVCAGGSCSAPITKPEEIRPKVDRLVLPSGRAGDRGEATGEPAR